MLSEVGDDASGQPYGREKLMSKTDRDHAVQLIREVARLLANPDAKRGTGEPGSPLIPAYPSKSLVDLFNAMNTMIGGKTITKFESREHALTRIAAVRDALASHISYDAAAEPEQEDLSMSNGAEVEIGAEAEPATEGTKGKRAPKARAPKAERAPRKAKESKGETKRGRYVGHLLFSKCDKNPRREGSIGYHSHQILLENPGIRYEEFLEKGGVPAALQWDIDKDLARVEKAGS